jgi:hypothetical protein
MTYDRPPVYLPSTPGYVLAVIRDWHRQQCRLDPVAEPDVELTFESTIAEWRGACDLLDSKRLGRALDGEFKLGRPDAAWRALLDPPKARTLRQLCEFIAQEPVRPSIEPLGILGSKCFTAGAFLAIRSLLRDAGAKVESVTPSTSLGEYTRHYPDVFLGPISRLAPMALPEVKVSTPWYDLSVDALVLVQFVACAGYFISALLGVGPFISSVATIAGVTLVLASFAAIWITARAVAPSEVTFGSLRTFGDLAKVVADGARHTDSHG